MRPREIGVSAVSTGAATYECTTVVTADLDALVARVATYEADNRDLTDRCNGLEAERDHYRRRANEARDCGQSGPCAIAPGCQRHWEERNRELAAEVAAGVARVAELEAGNARMREALTGLVDALPRCSNCGGPATSESCDGYSDHTYGCDDCGGLPSWPFAPQLRIARKALGREP